jgi:RimJ/RimL family protein N-acetyltransferase
MKTLFNATPTLTTERLELRAFRDADAPEMYVQRSDPRILRNTSVPKSINVEAALDFIHEIAEESAKGEVVAWAICLKGEEKLVGTICLWHFNLEIATAEIGYTLHPDYWGKGLASEATAAVVRFGFEEMEAILIEAFTKPENKPSGSLLKRAGFVKTGHADDYDSYALCRPPIGAIVLETERLRLREIRPNDAQFLFELLNTPDWIANIGDRQVRNLDDARKYAIYRIWANCRRAGFGFYLLERKSDKVIVGMCGLVRRDFLEDVDIGYALLPQFYSQGYVAEAALAVTHFAKQTLKLSRLAAITIEANKPSQRVLEKIGMRFERLINIPGDEEVLMLWGMDL